MEGAERHAAEAVLAKLHLSDFYRRLVRRRVSRNHDVSSGCYGYPCEVEGERQHIDAPAATGVSQHRHVVKWRFCGKRAAGTTRISKEVAGCLIHWRRKTHVP